jgi:hypothetical protein
MAARTRSALAGLALTAALLPSGVRGQGALRPVPPNLSSLIGVVDDRIRGGRLIGAVVTVTGTERRGTTDANGTFQIDSIAPGEHRISVSHPLLDTLGAEVLSAPFSVAGGQRILVSAQTPTFEEVRAKVCTRGGVAGETAILVGRVFQADDQAPAAGATVSLLFKDPTRKDPVDRVRTARASPTGSFAICGLPRTLEGNLQASLGGVTTADVPIKSIDESLATAILSIGGSGAGNAVLRGAVTSRGAGPVAGAQVTVTGTTTVAITKDDGSFTLSELPSGTHEAVVRKIGFAKASEIVHLTAAAPTSVHIVLDQATVLGTIRVVGKMENGLDKVGFLSRKQQGRGWYLTPEQIALQNPRVTSDLLRMTIGLRVIDAGSGRVLASTSSDGCINVFIDHARFDQMQPGDVDDASPTADLGAIEYYSSSSSAPAEFSVPGKTCATLVIWTKTRLTTSKP